MLARVVLHRLKSVRAGFGVDLLTGSADARGGRADLARLERFAESRAMPIKYSSQLI